MSAEDSTLRRAAAVVALLRGKHPPAHLADLIDDVGSAEAVLELEHGLLAPDLLAAAAADVASWYRRGLRALTPLHAEYPENLRGVHDRPPLIFVAGQLRPTDRRAVAVIGSRRASPAALADTRAITNELIASGYAIVSGLAAGVDTVAHRTALENDARTIAVLGTGLLRSYPPQNAALQHEIAVHGAVLSQFWPDDGPNRQTFPLRNATTSGLALATVIVEATMKSGARIQARQALAHGRPLLLAGSLVGQPWARDLARRGGTYVFRTAKDVPAIVDRVSSTEVPVS